MDITFNCPHCGLSLEVDQDAAGQQFDCPTCQKTVTVPSAPAQPAKPAPAVATATQAAGAVREEKRMAVPASQKSIGSLIQKPNKSLEVVAKESKPGIRVKTIRHSDCKDGGKDRFDDVVSEFLNKIGDQAIVSVTPINHSYLDTATQKILTDFGVMVIYRG
jgi:endogenous inhibitor of DNA gyrase (YacG/DUF329 family)